MVPRTPWIGNHRQMTRRTLVPGDRHPPSKRMTVTRVLDPTDRRPAGHAATSILSPVTGW